MQAGTALITGASSGIGEALARVMAAHGHDLVVAAPPQDSAALGKLADDLRQQHGITVTVLAEDLMDPAAPQRIHEFTTSREIDVEFLVNNAGYVVAKRFSDEAWDTWRRNFQVIFITYLHLAHLYLPAMLAGGHGSIVNVASLAGLVPFEASGDAVYAASKTGVIRFSEAMAKQLEGTGVGVTVVCPGFTRTRFHEGPQMGFADRFPAYMWMDADEVAREAYDAIKRHRTVFVPGRLNRMIARAARLIPRRIA